jgi:hypothetical protein
MKEKLDAVTSSITVLSGKDGLEKVSTQFNDILTLSDQINVKWQGIMGFFESLWNANPGLFLTSLLALGALSFAALLALMPLLLQAAGGAIGAGIVAAGGGAAVAGSGAVGAAAGMSLSAIAGAVFLIIGTAAAGAVIGTLIGNQLKNMGAFSSLGKWIESLHNPITDLLLGINNSKGPTTDEILKNNTLDALNSLNSSAKSGSASNSSCVVYNNQSVTVNPATSAAASSSVPAAMNAGNSGLPAGAGVSGGIPNFQLFGAQPGFI